MAISWHLRNKESTVILYHISTSSEGPSWCVRMVVGFTTTYAISASPLKL